MYDIETRGQLHVVARGRLGLFTYDDAEQAGLTRDQLDTDQRFGLVERPYHSVYAIAGIDWSPARRYLAATLAGGEGSRTTHRPGAWLWGLTPYEQRPEISIPSDRYMKIKGVRVHRASDLPETLVLRMRVPTTGVGRVLIDTASVLSRSKARDALDRAIARKLVTPMNVLAELNELARRGRPGVGAMRRLLDEAGVTGSHAPSVLEAKTRRLIKEAGLPQPECEFVAGENGEYRLDFVWPDLMLVVEVDGWQYHSSFEAFYQGMTRQNALSLSGYGFLKYSWMHVTREPRLVVDEMRTAYRARTALFV